MNSESECWKLYKFSIGGISRKQTWLFFPPSRLRINSPCQMNRNCYTWSKVVDQPHVNVKKRNFLCRKDVGYTVYKLVHTAVVWRFLLAAIDLIMYGIDCLGGEMYFFEKCYSHSSIKARRNWFMVVKVSGGTFLSSWSSGIQIRLTQGGPAAGYFAVVFGNQWDGMQGWYRLRMGRNFIGEWRVGMTEFFFFFLNGRM